MKVAVLIDAENISAVLDEQIRRLVASIGEPMIYRLFGCFSQGRLVEWVGRARLFGYEIAPQPTSMPKRGSSDIALTIHAMDILHQGIADAICIVSTDRDFVPLARRIRAGGHKAIGIGTEMSSAPWREACTQFHVVKDRQLEPDAYARSPGVTDSARVALVRLVHELLAGSEDGTLVPGQLASEVQKRLPGIYDLIGGEGRFLRNLETLGIAVGVGSGNGKRLKAVPLVLHAVKKA